MPSLPDRDARVCWHPFTQHGAGDPHLPVASAKGSLLFLEDGRPLIDAISSWWAILHGHAHPQLIDAMEKQARTLDHVLFAGTTHEPAVALAEKLVEISPGNQLTRVFFSDDGSTAVEVALKMAYQSHVHRGMSERRTFIAMEGAYHGDTFGAMSVGDRDPFFLPFEPLLFSVERVPTDAGRVREALERLGSTVAGVILEPLVQGAAGMRMNSCEFLREVRAACDAAGVPLIADEVMTGFGRTGSLFACEKAGIEPDFLCLAKGLTGGVFPMSVTMSREETFEAFLSEDRTRAFFHGHTFTAHPIGCAVALASLEITMRENTPKRLDEIGKRIAGILRERIGALEHVENMRRTGGIVAFDLGLEGGNEGGLPAYLAGIGPQLRARAIELGVLIRPLGNVIYALPPACTTNEQADEIANAMATLAEEAPAISRAQLGSL